MRYLVLAVIILLASIIGHELGPGREFIWSIQFHEVSTSKTHAHEYRHKCKEFEEWLTTISPPPTASEVLIKFKELGL